MYGKVNYILLSIKKILGISNFENVMNKVPSATLGFSLGAFLYWCLESQNEHKKFPRYSGDSSEILLKCSICDSLQFVMSGSSPLS